MTFIRVLVLILMALKGGMDVHAQNGNLFWEALPSPARATVTSLEHQDGGMMMAGTGAGLFISDNGGSSWYLRSPGSWPVSAVLATTAGTLLVGSYRHGVHRSTDDGLTWTRVGFENNTYIDAIIQDHRGRIYAAVAGAVGDEPTGLFRSDDDGLTWVQAGLAGENVHSVSVPLPGQLYAGTRRGTFRSTDNGENWALLESASFPAPLSEVVALGSTLFAGFAEPRYRAPGAGVWRSSDEGATWVPMTGLPPETSVHALVVVGDALFAACGDVLGRGGRGIYRSVDHRHWTPTGLNDEWLNALIVTPDGALFAGAVESGVFRKQPSVSGWTATSNGLKNWQPTALAFDAADRLYGLTLRELFAYDAPSRTWTVHALPEGTAAPTPFNFTSSKDGTLILSGQGGVFFSETPPESWSWREIPEVEGQVFDLHVTGDGRLFTTILREGAFETRDEGVTWTRLSVPEGTRGVYVSPAGTQFAFGRGIYRSEGDVWEKVGPDDQLVFDFISCGDTLFLAGTPQGIFSSQDDGRNWEADTEAVRLTAQQPGYLATNSLLCFPNGSLLTGTFSDGVLYREKSGSWRDVSEGLPTRSIVDIALGKDGSAYIVTASGVYSKSWLGASR